VPHPLLTSSPEAYRFYATNAQCKYIFLAVCHDNGYVATLDHYRQDGLIAPKTVLVKHPNMAAQFINLPFSSVDISPIFESMPERSSRIVVPKFATPSKIGPIAPPLPLSAPPVQPPEPKPRPVATSTPVKPSTPATSNPTPVKPADTTSPEPLHTRPAAPQQSLSYANKLRVSSPSPAPVIDIKPTKPAPKGIPVNAHGQRVDPPLKPPTSTDHQRFNARIAKQKLCNAHHLGGGCWDKASCAFNHDSIDPGLKATLRYKARNLPCSWGSDCRDAACYMGHHCPWGDGCYNENCAFERAGLHDVQDLKVKAWEEPAQVE